MNVAIITGASSGIGFGTAVKLAEAGMAVLGPGGSRPFWWPIGPVPRYQDRQHRAV